MAQTDSTIEIVPALSQDAQIICDIRDRAWLETYPNAELGITREDILLNAQGLDGVFLPRRIAYLQSQLPNTEGSVYGTFVAKANGSIVGYTDISSQDGKPYISAMYVAPEFQGKGIGGGLMRKALEVLGRSQDIYLEVVSYNDNAIGFYEHYGFVKTDAVVPDEEGRPDYMKSLPQTEMVLKASTA